MSKLLSVQVSESVLVCNDLKTVKPLRTLTAFKTLKHLRHIENSDT